MSRFLGPLAAFAVAFVPCVPRCVAQDASIPEAALHAKLFSFADPAKSVVLYFTPDGKKLLARSLTDRNLVTLHDIGSGVQLLSLSDTDLGNGTGQSVQMTLSADGKFFITSFEKQTRVWETDTFKPSGKTLLHENEVWSAALSKDNKRILAATGNPARTRADVQIWDLAAGKMIISPIKTEEPVLARWSRDEAIIMLVPSRESRIVFWDAEKRMQVGEIDARYRSAYFAPDGKRMFVWNTNADIRLFDAASREPLGEGVPLPRPRPLLERWWRGVAFHADDKSVLLLDETKAILWDLSAAKPAKLKTLEHGALPNAATPYSVTLSADGKRAAIACTSMKRTPFILVWDLEKAEQLFQVPLGRYVLQMAFSPDGRFLATVDTHEARLWSMKAGKGG